jgi:hypothetical protein
MALSSSHLKFTCGRMGVLGLREEVCVGDYPLGSMYALVIAKHRTGLEFAKTERDVLASALFS